MQTFEEYLESRGVFKVPAVPLPSILELYRQWLETVALAQAQPDHLPVSGRMNVLEQNLCTATGELAERLGWTNDRVTNLSVEVSDWIARTGSAIHTISVAAKEANDKIDRHLDAGRAKPKAPDTHLSDFMIDPDRPAWPADPAAPADQISAETLRDLCEKAPGTTTEIVVSVRGLAEAIRKSFGESMNTDLLLGQHRWLGDPWFCEARAAIEFFRGVAPHLNIVVKD